MRFVLPTFLLGVFVVAMVLPRHKESSGLKSKGEDLQTQQKSKPAKKEETAPQKPTLAATAPLSIAEPLDGTTLLPNNQIPITVRQGAGLAPFYFNDGVALVVLGPFDISEIKAVDPYRFTLSVRADAPPGEYYLTAYGKRKGQPPVESAPVRLVINAQGVERISTSPKSVHLFFIGAQSTISVFGLSSMNAEMILPESQISFASGNTSIATVSADGLITALASGTATITVSYKNMTAKVDVTVASQKLKGDLNNDGIVNLDDLNIIKLVLNTPAQVLNDARDLNHDGRIDTLDVQLLTTLCTYPKCAYSK